MKKLSSIVISFLLLSFFLTTCVEPVGQSLADLQIASPGNFTALPNAGAATITLSWTASSQASSYQVLRSTSDGGYTPLTETPNLTHTDTGLLPDKAYWYLLVAKDTAGGRSAGVKAVMTLSGFPAPTGLAASDRTGSSIRLTWNRLPGATGYRLYKSEDGATFTEIATPTMEEYVDSGLESQKSFWYQVSAFNASVEGARSAVLATSTVTGGIAPPTGLTITNRSASSVELTWDIMPGVNGYKVYRSANNSSYNLLDTRGGDNNVFYSDNGLQPETNYWYKVASYSWTDSGEVEGLSAALATSTLAAFKAVEVAAGQTRSYAVKSDGTVWGWGSNTDGWLGDGTTTDRLIPVQIPGLANITGIAAHFEHVLALKNDGNLMAWGVNDWGQVGDGTATNKQTPVSVLVMSDVVEITAGSFHSLARKSDGTLWGWGANFQGQLGDGTNNSRQTPALIASITDVESISAGWDFTVAAKDDGTVWSWGSNSNGQLGDGSTMSSLIPVAVAGISNIEKVAAKYYHVLALRLSDGTVWAWGGNWQGQLGNGTTTNSSNPVQVQGLSGVIAIAAGHDHSVALKSDGTVWAWGNQSTLGVEIVADYRIPVQVTSLSGITSISAGSSYTLAVGGDGTVWAWGHNWSGQLGDGTTNYRLLPTAVTAP